MQWFIDHLTAVIIAGTILFILAVLQLRGGNASVESTQYYSAKAAIHPMIDMIEQDFSNIGAGMVNPGRAIMSIDTSYGGATDTMSFTFRGRTRKSSLDTLVIRYEWRQAGTYTDKGGHTIPKYAVRRLVGASSGTLSAQGGSLESVTDLRITLRNDSLNVIRSASTVQLARTKVIDVRLDMVSPLGEGDLIEKTRWHKEIRPINLQRNQFSMVMP